MSNVVTLHGTKRWKAVIEYQTETGIDSIEYYFEEIADLHSIIEHGPDWNGLIKCVVTLNRHDDGTEQKSVEMAKPSGPSRGWLSRGAVDRETHL